MGSTSWPSPWFFHKMPRYERCPAMLWMAVFPVDIVLQILFGIVLVI